MFCLFVISLYVLLVPRHRRVNIVGDKLPRINKDAWVAPNSALFGEVVLGDESTVWYNTVIRGECARKQKRKTFFFFLSFLFFVVAVKSFNKFNMHRAL
jgi:hypothetical protein